MKYPSPFEAGYCWSITKGYTSNFIVNYIVSINKPASGAIGIKTKLKKYYENICISSDFDGLIDPINLFSCPRMYPVLALYISNRLKWDLYRRYCAKPIVTSPGNREYIEGNNTIGAERGQALDIDEGAYKYLNYFRDLDADGIQLNNNLNIIVRDIIKQILDTNFINMVAYAQAWTSLPVI